MAQIYEDGSSKILKNLEDCRKRNNLVIDRIENNLDVSVEKAINNLLERGIISQEDVKNLEDKGIKIDNQKSNKSNEIKKENDNIQKIDYDNEIEL